MYTVDACGTAGCRPGSVLGRYVAATVAVLPRQSQEERGRVRCELVSALTFASIVGAGHACMPCPATVSGP
jgi:hypothetical protein